MRSSIPLFALVVVMAAIAVLVPWAGSAPSALPPVQRFTDATTAQGHQNPTWCPDGSQIAFEDRDADPSNPSLYYKNYPSGTETQMAGPPRTGVDYAPDLTQIVYSKVDGTWSHIYVRPIGGGSETAITTGTAGPGAPAGFYGDIQPSFSPDGQWVTFASSRNDPTYGSFDIWVVKTDGTGIKKIAAGSLDFSFWPTWEPGGNAVVYSSQAQLFRVPRTGVNTWGTAVMIENNANHPRFSHDGKWLAFDFGKDVYVMNYATKNRVNITGDGAAVEDYAPTWGADDDRIAFSSKGREGVAQTDIWIATGIQSVPTEAVTLGKLKDKYR